MTITGLQASETIIGADIRPADGMLYALTNAARIYTINTTTGAASLRSTLSADPADTQDGNAPYSGLSDTDYGVDFNPTVDRLRVVTNSGQNLRINVDLGSTITDGMLRVNGQTRMGIGAVGYTSSFSSACRTVASLIDVVNNRLLTGNLITGVLSDIGPLNIDVAAVSGYEIVTGSDGTDSAFGLLQVAGGGYSLYSINLTTGAVAANPTAFTLNAGESVVGLAIAIPQNPPPQAIGAMLGLSETNRLISFNTNVPGRLCTSVQISGLQNGERLLGMDTRPADGLIYALGTSANIYTIDMNSGAATVKSTLNAAQGDDNPYTGLTGTEYAFEFNPQADAIRVLVDNGQNLVINADNGVTTTQTTLRDTGPTPVTSSATSLAYSNGFRGTGSILAYVLDTTNDRVMSLGLASGGAANGDLLNIGPLNVGGDVQPISSLEVNGVNNQAFAALTVGSATTSQLAQIALPPANFSVSMLGTIGGSERIRALAVSRVPQTTIVGATANNQLVSFTLQNPAQTQSVQISGLLNGDSILGIDYRPANGLLYALGSTGQIYTLNTTTGAATPIATLSPDPTDTTIGAPFTSLMGANFAFDFNPAADAIRVFSDTEQNYRIGPDRGNTFTDAVLNRNTATVNGVTFPPFAVSSVAYTNSVAPLPQPTTLYDIDTANDVLLIQTPQNNGTLIPVGPLGVDVQAANGFEIVGANTAFAVLPTTAAPFGFYNINLTTGAASLVGSLNLPAGSTISGVTAPSTATPAANSTVYAIVNGTAITTFTRNAPAANSAPQTITGLAANDTLLGADLRPTDSLLYAVSRQNNLYRIDPTTAVATLLAPLSVALSGNNFGVDVSPGADALRVISDTGQNVAINYTTTPGAVTVATALNFVSPDIVAVGYTNNYAMAPNTRALVIDAPTGSLYRVNDPIGTGQLLPIGRIDPTITFSAANGVAFDIVGGTDGLALAAIQPDGASQSTLYRVNPVTGQSTSLGPIGAPVLRSMAIRLQ